MLAFLACRLQHAFGFVSMGVLKTNKQAGGKKASLRPPPSKTTLRALSFDYLLVANKGTPPEMTKQED